MHTCPLCTYQSNRKNNLKQHMEKCGTKIIITEFPCTECEYIATTKQNLKVHNSRVHESVHCFVCNKSVTDQEKHSKDQSHIRTRNYSWTKFIMDEKNYNFKSQITQEDKKELVEKFKVDVPLYVVRKVRKEREIQNVKVEKKKVRDLETNFTDIINILEKGIFYNYEIKTPLEIEKIEDVEKGIKIYLKPTEFDGTLMTHVIYDENEKEYEFYDENGATGYVVGEL